MAEIKNFPNNADEYCYAQDAMKWLYPRTQGVYGAGDNLSVEALETPDMAVSVSDGLGWLKDAEGNGCVFWNDVLKESGEKLTVSISAASSTQSRIDRIIVSWTPAGYVAKPQITVLEGTPATVPTAPAITNDGGTRQISIARIRIPAGATAITDEMITDERLDETVCGLVTEAVGIDTSTMQKQFAALLALYEAALEAATSGGIVPHASTHALGGSDAITPSAIGAAAEPSTVTGSGVVSFAISNNTKYKYSSVSSITIKGNKNTAKGFITFGSTVSTISVSGFDAEQGDDIREAAAKEKWEFNTEDGCVIWTNWGVI